MPCPRCKIDLSPKAYEKVNIESCGKCGGIWLDAGKLPPILSAHDMNFPPAFIEKTLKEAHTGVPKAEIDAPLPCPRCERPMNAVNYDYSSGVIIHACPSGQGLWFDKDQLAEVQIFMEHWDVEISRNKEKWVGVAKQAQQDEYAEMDRQDRAMEKGETPILRAIDAVLYEFEKLGK